jgi:hypothetical protein
MKLVINEKEIVRNALDEGYIHNKPSITIICLIKHFFGIGMDKKQVRESIESFMKDNYKKFNSVKWADKLDRWVNSHEKKTHDLLEIKDISITDKELEFIKQLENKEYERLAFTYLVYSKIFNIKNNNDSYYVNAPRSEVFKDAKVSAITMKQRLIINDLMSLGVLEQSKRDDRTNKRVCFTDNSGNIKISVSDFRNFVYEYSKWCGESIVNCELCNVLVRQSSNRKKYCDACWKEKEREIWRENKRKNRNVQV